MTRIQKTMIKYFVFVLLIAFVFCKKEDETVFVPYSATEYDGKTFYPGTSVPVAIRQPRDVLVNYLVHLLNRNYTAMATLFHPNIIFKISGSAVYKGAAVVLAYQQITDGDYSDVTINLNQTIVNLGTLKSSLIGDKKEKDQFVKGKDAHGKEQSVNVTGTAIVVANVIIAQHSIQKDVNYTFESVLTMYVDSDFKIVAAVYTQDLYQLLPYFPNVVFPNATEICLRVMSYCTGVYEQYDDFDACYAYVSSLPPLPTSPAQGLTIGKHQMCVGFHTTLAKPSPQIHCPHVGTQLNQPCQDMVMG